MASPGRPAGAVRFGPFEYNPDTGELRRRGYRIKLLGQPRQLLNLMIKRPGEVVTREEMRARLWPRDTFVDFEHSLNTAIKKLRQALGDSAVKPRFIETIARQGYRLIASVEAAESNGVAPVFSPALPPAAPPATPKASAPWTAIWLPIFVLAAVAAVIGFMRRSHHAPNHSKFTLLIAGEGDVADPVISPDGKMLAYVQMTGRTRRIYVRRLAGGPAMMLLHDDGSETEPAFSPRGERIAFTRYPAGSNRPQICIAPLFGGSMDCVASGDRDPAWSPNGLRLAFVRELHHGAEALATSRSDGTGVQTILIGDSTYPFIYYPSWSADGRSIAIERSMGGASGEIWVVPAEAGVASRLPPVRPGVSMHHPVFTRDGRGLIYSSNRAGATNLWYRSIGKNVGTAQLTRGPGPEVWPSVSRTGQVVFLKSESKDSLFQAHLATGATSRLLGHSPFLWAPAVSPDGQEIAYSQGEYNGLWRIWMVSLSGAHPRPLTSGREPQIYSRFSRDGQWLIYFTWAPGRSRIWRVSVHGGKAEPLTPANEDASYGDLSPDGRTLAFTRTEQGAAHICVMPVGGGPERQLIHSPSTLPRWSPDGKWITFSSDRGFADGISITHPDGSGIRQLTHQGGWPVWLPDGKRIAFRIVGPGGAQQIEAISLANGKVVTLGNIQFADDNEPFDFSPDGKLIVYTNRQTFSSEIWLLELRQYPPAHD